MSKKKQADINPALYDVLRTPVITEKSTMAAENDKVVFRISANASKKDVKQAIESLFNVSVVKVNTLNRKGKNKTFRGVKGRQSDVKHAVVTLAKDQTIDFSGGVN